MTQQANIPPGDCPRLRFGHILRHCARYKSTYYYYYYYYYYYAVARCLFVCLSVRPSHAGIESKRLHISSKFFSPLGSPTILVYPNQTGWQYFDGDPPNGGTECKGGVKKSRFATNIGLYLGTDARGIQSTRTQSQLVPSQLVPKSTRTHGQLVPKSTRTHGQLVPKSTRTQGQLVPKYKRNAK